MTKEVKGIFVAMITPFTERGEIYSDGIRNIVEWLERNRVHGIFPNSSTGEALKMKSNERITVAKKTVEAASSNVMVTPGVSGNTIEHALSEARQIADLGADAVVIIPPYYYKLSMEAMEKYYTEIAERVDIPIILYNIPSAACNFLDVELVKTLSENDKFIGIKDSSGNIEHIRALIKEIGNKISVMQGSELLLLPTLALGGRGGVLGVANLVPKLFVELYNAFMSKDLEKASALQILAYDVLDAVYLGSADSFFYCVKYALNSIGIDVGYPRQPYTIPSEKEEERVRKLIDTLKEKNLL